MTEKSAPYEKLLGIAPEPGPMTLYRLLGLERFESDPAVIAAAAKRQIATLRQAQSGQYSEQAQKLLNQVRKAHQHLADEDRRNEYNQKLRARLAENGGRPPVKRTTEEAFASKPNARAARQKSNTAKSRSQHSRPKQSSSRTQRSVRSASARRHNARPKRKTSSSKAKVIGGLILGTVGLLALVLAPQIWAPAEAPTQPQSQSPTTSPVELASDLESGGSAAEEVPSNDESLAKTATIAAAPPKKPELSAENLQASTSPMGEPTRPPRLTEAPTNTPTVDPKESTFVKAKGSTETADQSALDNFFVQKTGPFFEQHCNRCHSLDREEGGLRIDQLTTDLDDLESVDHYQNILDEITVGSMPPEDEPQPDSTSITEVLEALTSHIEAAKRKHESGGGRPARRLTKIEYTNTVFDLTGVHVNAASLQNDGTPGTFDTQADSLYTTDMHVESYLKVSQDVVRRFIASRSEKPGRRELKILPPPQKSKKPKEALLFQLPGKSVPPAGHLVAAFSCWKASPDSKEPLFTRTSLRVGREVLGTPSRPQSIKRIFYQAKDEPWSRTPGMVLGQIKRTQVISSQPYLFFEQDRKKFAGRKTLPDSAAKPIIARFANLMSRGRKLDPQLITGLNRVFLSERQQGRPFWEAIVQPMALSMCTIEAMLHLEDADFYARNGSISPIDLAGRMSYFLWRSAPDSELIELANSGKLTDPVIRGQQIERMMNDDRFDRFLRDFSNQWLELERQAAIAVDDRLFRKFDIGIRPSMKEETLQFMSQVIGEDLPLDNLIDSDFAMVNNVMASHYGMPRIEGDEFRKVKLTSKDRRGGILTQAGILMQTGTGERSSIVERGVFIAKKMMNSEPPPPPPLIDDLPTSGQNFVNMTGAQLVRTHARLPQCASCHKKIDPMGLGLEEFDAIGLHRTKDLRIIPNYNKLTKGQKKRLKNPTFAVPLETKGSLVTGQKFQGAEGLKRALMRNKKRLAKSYVEGLLTFANGRKSGIADQAIIDDIVKQTSEANYPARSIVKAIVESSAFTSN